jgi:hypothetical protein
VAELESKRTLERPRRKWEDDIKMYHEEIKWEVVEWISLA